MKKKLLALFGIVAAFCVVAPSTARAQESTGLDVVRVGTFSQTLPVLAANANGFWAANGIDARFLQVTGSIQQAQALRDGEYDLVFTAADNTANYRFNTNNPLGEALDFQIIAGTDMGGGLSYFSKPGYPTIESTTTSRIIVDATDSGFAFVLYKMFRAHGLERGRDYNVTPVGGVFQRFQALLNNQADATLLSGGFEVRAPLLGWNKLAHVNDVIDVYFSGEIAGSERWMKRHHDVVVRFLRAYYQGVQWAMDPANRAAATQLLVNATTSAFVANKLYESQVLASDGLISDISVNETGLFNVLTLRQEFAGWDTPKSADELRQMSSRKSGLWTNKYRREALYGDSDF